MQRSEVETLVNKLKQSILAEMKNENYDNALAMISTCANVLYQTNLYYMDSMLEESVAAIANKLMLAKTSKRELGEMHEDKVLFYDGFGINDRGLAQIYLKALCKIKKVVYVTWYNRKEDIPDLVKILDYYHCEIFYIKQNRFSIINQIRQLERIIEDIRPGYMFFYSTPDDVTAVSIMSAYVNQIERYQINLTDHAFWLGSSCIDKCIEFREHGAKISREYRKIPEEKIVIIPYYPIIHYNRKFEGYPFEVKDGQKVIFSGGALYKTLGGDNKYYHIVDHILATYKDAIFWYAGNGDETEMKKLQLKYSGRIHLTPERSDLYQLLGKCRFYLNTYPLGGGLMLQYAALAGVVPVTLKYGDALDGILLNQSELGIEFKNVEELYKEIDRLMTDDGYISERKQQLQQAVILPEIFEDEIYKLLSGENSDRFPVKYEHIDTTEFRQSYLERIKSCNLKEMLVRTNAMRAAIRYYPLRFLGGGIHLSQKNYCEVSVIVAEYRPKKQALFLTLSSLIRQKGISFQIIIVDDGSEYNYFGEIAEFFEKQGFSEYKLVEHVWNQGTVNNFMDGIRAADGSYVKGISPGDCLISEYTLRDWVGYLKKENYKWSFCDAVYYRNTENGKYEICSGCAHPQKVSVYKKADKLKCRWNYIVLGDIALGAAIICEKDLLERYLLRLVGKVKYADDNIYRLMMFDGIVGGYYAEKGLLYEYGEGISTSGNQDWSRKITEDWKKTDEIMLDRETICDEFSRKLAREYQKRNCAGKMKQRINMVRQKGKISMALKCRFFPRKTSIKYDVVKILWNFKNN